MYYTYAHAHILCKERVVNKIRQFIFIKYIYMHTYIYMNIFSENFLLSHLVLIFVLSCNHIFICCNSEESNTINRTHDSLLYFNLFIFVCMCVCVCDKHKDSPIKLIAELLKISCYRPLNLPA